MANSPTTPKSKRCLVQFSLRTAFIVVTAVCIALSFWIVPLERKRWAVAAIEAVGGNVWYSDYVQSHMKQATTDEPTLKSFFRRWLPQHYFDDIRFVDLGGSQITDAGLADLQGLTGLHVLWLYSTQVTDAGLIQLEGLTSLNCLHLGDTQITDAGLVHLQSMIDLQVLRLDATQITDTGLSYLQGMTCLHELSLDDTQVTDAGLAHLQKLKDLQMLYLWNTHVTDAGLAKLQEALPNCGIMGP